LLSPPVTDLEPFQPLARLVEPSQPMSIGNRRQAGSAENVFEKLQLQNVGTKQPCSMQLRDGVLVIVAGGSDIWATKDEFAYARTLMAGDFDFRMQVRSIAPALDKFTRVGLMAREGADSSRSRHVMVTVNAQNSFQVVTRSAEGAEAVSVPQNPLPAAYGSNSWVRLQRVGAIFHAYTSSNGVDWTQLYQTTGGDKPFSDPIYFGIAAGAHSTNDVSTNLVSGFGVTPAVSPDAAVTLALLEYRRGDVGKSVEWCERVLRYPESSITQITTAQIVLKMAYKKMGRMDEAREQLASAREVVQAKFSEALGSGNKTDGYWFDWVFMRALLQEATALD
jgi:hypothetical protein